MHRNFICGKPCTTSVDERVIKQNALAAFVAKPLEPRLGRTVSPSMWSYRMADAPLFLLSSRIKSTLFRIVFIVCDDLMSQLKPSLITMMNLYQKIVLLLFLSHMSLTWANVCRCFPGDACWPSLASWNSLNSSVGGRLLPPSFWVHHATIQITTQPSAFPSVTIGFGHPSSV